MNKIQAKNRKTGEVREFEEAYFTFWWKNKKASCGISKEQFNSEWEVLDFNCKED